MEFKIQKSQRYMELLVKKRPFKLFIQKIIGLLREEGLKAWKIHPAAVESLRWVRQGLISDFFCDAVDEMVYAKHKMLYKEDLHTAIWMIGH